MLRAYLRDSVQTTTYRRAGGPVDVS